jgi:hypothetical protein
MGEGDTNGVVVVDLVELVAAAVEVDELVGLEVVRRSGLGDVADRAGPPTAPKLPAAEPQ